MYIRCYRCAYTFTLELCRVSSTAACNSSGTPNNTIFSTNLLLDRPAAACMALRPSMGLLFNTRYTAFTLATATASFASFHCSSLKPFWITREYGKNKSHYRTQDFTSVACPQCYQWRTWMFVCTWCVCVCVCVCMSIHNTLYILYMACILYIIVTCMYEHDGIYYMKRQ